MSAPPLILTLGLDAGTQQRFDAERAQHFPAGRTAVGAHVTLFHALPATLRPEVEDVLAGVGGRLDVEVIGLRSLGRGVAYDLDCAPLARLHRDWQQRWREHLTRQDAQRLRLHVTVQNKVGADEARRTLALLQGRFAPWTAHGESLELWRYDGGPWTWLRSWPL